MRMMHQTGVFINKNQSLLPDLSMNLISHLVQIIMTNYTLVQLLAYQQSDIMSLPSTRNLNNELLFHILNLYHTVRHSKHMEPVSI